MLETTSKSLSECHGRSDWLEHRQFEAQRSSKSLSECHGRSDQVFSYYLPVVIVSKSLSECHGRSDPTTYKHAYACWMV